MPVKHRGYKPKSARATATLAPHASVALITASDRYERTGGQGYRLSALAGAKGKVCGHIDPGYRSAMAGGDYIFPELEGYSSRKRPGPGWAWRPQA